MRISYDPEVDAVYIGLSDEKPVDSHEVNQSVTVDLDNQGRVVSIEILDATEHLGESALDLLLVEGLTVQLHPEEPGVDVHYSRTVDASQ